MRSSPYEKIASRNLDLTNSAHLEKVLEIAEKMLLDFSTSTAIAEFEKVLIEKKDEHPLMVHLAVKLAKSKRVLLSISKPAHITIVFAVYKEHNRIRTKEEHPHGENFLLRKIKQLNWLFNDMPNFSWDMTIVDDGDPEKSGEIAQEILAEKYAGNNVKVLFLEEAIQKGVPVTHPMQSASESRKGASIIYGMWDAIQQKKRNHIVVFTDADLSTHLGQVGLLIEPIIKNRKDSAIGSRREKESVVVKKGARNNRGKLFIYLWKRMLPNLSYIIDTQCGFKAFTAETVACITPDTIEKQFAFDIELLLKTELHHKDSIEKVPIAWIDSEAASTTTDIQPYLSMLKSTAKMYRKYLPENESSSKFADFILSLAEEKWNLLLSNIPEEIKKREPLDFNEYQGISVNDLKAILEG
ncbi:MAG: hypothetical protein HN392_05885 [Anaerolineae bacterium]|jgi:hypothetical protein|nr:hypothetical protein [Anaerolineae bacterium]MBT7074059.1 hypothetical protein [Anaerolineae bacterium]MBT7782776.1 hypothetical protein [Anaerolineae bacterium]